MIHTKFSILDSLSRRLDAYEYGRSLMILNHENARKVWVLSFDTDRYLLYQDLGIQVSTQYKRIVTYVSQGRICWQPYDVFECEWLTDGLHLPKHAQRQYVALYNMWQSGDYRHIQLAINLEHNRVCNDWGISNVLYRPSDESLFLSDVLSNEQVAPCDVSYDPSQFNWVQELVKEKSRDLESVCCTA